MTAAMRDRFQVPRAVLQNELNLEPAKCHEGKPNVESAAA